MTETMAKAHPHSTENEPVGDAVTEKTQATACADLPTRKTSRPFEPAVPDAARAATNNTLFQLLEFLAHSKQSSPTSLEPAWPALLDAYRDLDHYRHAYPLCLLRDEATGHGGEQSEVARSVSRIIDDVLAAADLEGDAAEHLKRDLYQLEAKIKSTVEPRTLGQRWQWAAESTLSDQHGNPEDQQRLSNNLDLARLQLEVDGDLLACGPNLPLTLCMAVYRSQWRRKCDSWSGQLQVLIRGLEDILQAEFDRSDAARTPEHLRDSVGTTDADDMDFERLSGIMSKARLGQPLPAERHARIEQILKTLKDARPLFGASAFATEASPQPPFSMQAVHNDCLEATTQQAHRMRIMAMVFRASEIAELELENRYRERLHDEYFANYDPTYLNEKQLALCPPVVLAIDADFAIQEQAGALMDLLVSGLPVKLVNQLDAHPHAPAAPWHSRVAGIALANNRTFVFQGTASDPTQLQQCFQLGLGYSGPAVFSVYTGAADSHSLLPAYLDCAAALECRAFPSYCYNPANGPTQAQRMHLLNNPGPELAWPMDQFEYDNCDNETRQLSLSFTLADYLACDRRFNEHFWAVPVALWHPNMMPLSAYLDTDQEQRESAIPFLSAVRPDGEMLRVIPDRTILEIQAGCADEWRALQEAGGIQNSHAQRLLAEQQGRLEGERDLAIEESRQQYEQQLDQDVGGLTREIVSRIASQLLTGASSVPAMAPTPMAAPEAARESAPAAAEAEPVTSEAESPANAPVETENFALDDPYIDTPLCTTCDDCTNMSPLVFAYDENKQAYIKDPVAGTFQELVLAAEKCPVKIIHPGKPSNPDEPDLEKWIERAGPFQ